MIPFFVWKISRHLQFRYVIKDVKLVHFLADQLTESLRLLHIPIVWSPWCNRGGFAVIRVLPNENAPPAIGRNPSSTTVFLSSKRASSYSLFPYTTTTTAGVLLPLIRHKRRTASGGIRPAYTGSGLISYIFLTDHFNPYGLYPHLFGKSLPLFR